jgi:murein DD-endopeptidase MepM/ murein hydrolase activator NlpD
LFKSLTSFLTAVSISGAGPVYDLVSAGPLPDYLGSDVDLELEMLEFPEHFQDKETPSVKPSSTLVPSTLPPLPPTGTLGTGAQAYGAPRAGGTRKHAGVDFDPADDKNSKFFSRIGGEVIYAANAGGGYGNVVDIYNAELGVTERIAEGNKIHVKKGDIVKPGTLVQSGSEMTGVFHYEIRKGRAGHSGAFEGTVDPLKFLEQLKANPNQASIRTSPSSLISSAGLDQPTTYSSEGMSVRREVNNIFIPIAA